MKKIILIALMGCAMQVNGQQDSSATPFPIRIVNMRSDIMPYELSRSSKTQKAWLDTCHCDMYTVADRWNNKYKYMMYYTDSGESKDGMSGWKQGFSIPLVPLNHVALWLKRDTLRRLRDKSQSKYLHKGEHIGDATDYFYYCGQVDMLTAILEPEN